MQWRFYRNYILDNFLGDSSENTKNNCSAAEQYKTKNIENM